MRSSASRLALALGVAAAVLSTPGARASDEKVAPVAYAATESIRQGDDLESVRSKLGEPHSIAVEPCGNLHEGELCWSYSVQHDTWARFGIRLKDGKVLTYSWDRPNEKFTRREQAKRERASAMAQGTPAKKRRCVSSARFPDVAPIHTFAKVRVTSAGSDIYRVVNEKERVTMRLKTIDCAVQVSNESAKLETCVANMFALSAEPPQEWNREGNWVDIVFGNGARCPVAVTLEAY